MAVFWVGGPAAAGKTTVSRLFARKHGFLWYSVDAHNFAHEKRAAAAGLHVLGTGPGDFDRRPMILDDIESLSLNTSVVVEGAFVTPTVAGDAKNAVWLMPSKEEQLARLQRRNPDDAYDGYLWGWNLIHSQLEGTLATVLVVDGQTIDQTLTAVEQTFRPLLKSAPAAHTIPDRQTLIRLSNHQLAKQFAERGAQVNNHKPVFDCECAHPNCTNLVALPTDQIPTLLGQQPPSIVSPNHSHRP